MVSAFASTIALSTNALKRSNEIAPPTILSPITNVGVWLAPRFVATSDTIWLTNRIPRATERELMHRGYPVKRSPLTFHFAGVHGIRIVDGKLDGAADPGRDGTAMAA